MKFEDQGEADRRAKMTRKKKVKSELTPLFTIDISCFVLCCASHMN